MSGMGRRSRKVKVDDEAPVEYSMPTTDVPSDGIVDPDIPDMIETVRQSGCSETFDQFLSSLEEFYENQGYLTPRQYDALDKAYCRTVLGEK